MQPDGVGVSVHVSNSNVQGGARDVGGGGRRRARGEVEVCVRLEGEVCARRGGDLRRACSSTKILCCFESVRSCLHSLL